jgi:hypothetical protein
MHPDPTPEQPVIHIKQTPMYVNQADGTVRAYYAGEAWHVVGADKHDATMKLRDEFDRKIQDPEYIADHLTRAKQHLNGEVTPGFEVNTISQADYRQRTEELGDQLRRP